VAGDLTIGLIDGPPYLEPAKAYLEPARIRGGLPDLIGEHELLWGVLDGSGLIAAATARLTVDDVCEVVLVGGRDHGRWLHELDEAIGRAAADAGALRMRAYGRRGWARVLGWNVLGEQDGFTAYERAL
jgi:hypothetical protein